MYVGAVTGALWFGFSRPLHDGSTRLGVALRGVYVTFLCFRFEGDSADGRAGPPWEATICSEGVGARPAGHLHPPTLGTAHIPKAVGSICFP